MSDRLTVSRQPRTAALDGCRVDEPQIVGVARAVAGEGGDDVLHHVGGGAESFVVRGALGQVREPRPKMGVGVADEATLRGVAEQRLDDGEGDQFGIAELRGDADSGSFRSPLRMILDERRLALAANAAEVLHRLNFAVLTTAEIFAAVRDLQTGTFDSGAWWGTRSRTVWV